MNLDLMKTINKIQKLAEKAYPPNFSHMERLYGQVMRLRSQVIAIMYDLRQYGAEKGPSYQLPIPQTGFTDKRVVTLSVPEPLPGKREVTSSVAEHWMTMLHAAIAEETKTGIPVFEKAFVWIEITTPHGSPNQNVWDTSNRAINLIINNLKGIFFRDDNFEHMAFGVVAKWGTVEETKLHICSIDELATCIFWNKEEKIHGHSVKVMEK